MELLRMSELLGHSPHSNSNYAEEIHFGRLSVTRNANPLRGLQVASSSVFATQRGNMLFKFCEVQKCPGFIRVFV